MFFLLLFFSFPSYWITLISISWIIIFNNSNRFPYPIYSEFKIKKTAGKKKEKIEMGVLWMIIIVVAVVLPTNACTYTYTNIYLFIEDVIKYTSTENQKKRNQK